MCGRYAMFGPVNLSREALAQLERMEMDIEADLNQRESRFNIAPTQLAPVVIVTEDKSRYETKALRWGLVPSWAKDTKIGGRMINARAETVQSKPGFRSAFKKRRCLVPASGYYEWTGVSGSKQAYFIHKPNDELLIFAGLWEAWRATEQDSWLRTFTIITGEASKVSADIHDRQPVILPPECWSDWLDGDTSVAQGVLENVEESTLLYYPVGKSVANPRNDDPSLIVPIEIDQR